ncbi:hypothetical protein KKE60_04135 [Patescibacteria group bacterium]|nr:hypothetical protein [Patescibacteria group bacterium]
MPAPNGILGINIAIEITDIALDIRRPDLLARREYHIGIPNTGTSKFDWDAFCAELVKLTKEAVTEAERRVENRIDRGVYRNRWKGR